MVAKKATVCSIFHIPGGPDRTIPICPGEVWADPLKDQPIFLARVAKVCIFRHKNYIFDERKAGINKLVTTY